MSTDTDAGSGGALRDILRVIWQDAHSAGMTDAALIARRAGEGPVAEDILRARASAAEQEREHFELWWQTHEYGALETLRGLLSDPAS